MVERREYLDQLIQWKDEQVIKVVTGIRRCGKSTLLAQYQGYADVQSGRGAIVIGLASVIIGEVLIGRRANFAVRMGSIIVGSIVYYVIISFVLQLGLNTSDLKLFSALVVAIALAIPSLRQKLALRQKLSLRGGAAGKGR